MNRTTLNKYRRMVLSMIGINLVAELIICIYFNFVMDSTLTDIYNDQYTNWKNGIIND